MQTKPLIIKNISQENQTSNSLEAISLEAPPYNEDWLQKLIHNHPELIPTGEIEACFNNIIPVLREFTLPCGNLDNFYITPDGYPVLVEVKLWKNQESRRKVIAQILEYAKEFAALSYEDINDEIRKKFKDKVWGNNPLYELASNYAANVLEEDIFVDRVTRNLREGRFLLLILGDGIREEMASLANYFMHHIMRYSFGMVQIKLFKTEDNIVFVQPSILSKTQTIERHVTVISSQNDGVSVSASIPKTIFTEKIEKTSISLDAFYEIMAEKDPQNVVFVKDLIEKLSNTPIETEMGSKGESLMFKLTTKTGERLQFMFLTTEKAEFWGIPAKEWKDPIWQNLSLTYLENISSLIPGSNVQISNSMANVKLSDKNIRLNLLQGKARELAGFIKQVMEEAEAYYSARSD